MNFVIEDNTHPIITVIGVGGAGSNAVTYMYENGVSDVNYIVCNTDLKALDSSSVPTKVQLGVKSSDGDGAGNNALNGKNAAIESLDELLEHISEDTKMVFITAGMGGGTGTGATPVLAQALKKRGILTVGIVSIPFHFEGKKRINQAAKGIIKLNKYIDSLIIVDNERIFDLYPDIPFEEAYSKVDDVVTNAAKGVSELINLPGYVNVDFQDVRTVLKESGVALMGTASASGEERAYNSIKTALESPLLENSNIRGAKNILLNIISSHGDSEVRMDEICEITDYVTERVGEGAQVLWGCGYDNKLEDNISVTIVATDFDSKDIEQIMSLPDIDFTRIRTEVSNEEKEVVAKSKYQPDGPVCKCTNDSEEELDMTEGIVVPELPIDGLSKIKEDIDSDKETLNTINPQGGNEEESEINLVSEELEIKISKEVVAPVSINDALFEDEIKECTSVEESYIPGPELKVIPNISMSQAVMKNGMSEVEIIKIESIPAYERHRKLIE